MTKTLLEVAKLGLDKLRQGEIKDPQDAIFVMACLPEVQTAGLNDLAWALLYTEAIYYNDAIRFFELLIKYLEKQP